MDRPPPSATSPARPELPDGVEPTPGPRDPLSLAPVALWAPFAGLFAVFAFASVAVVFLAVVVEALGVKVPVGNAPPGVLIGGSVVQDVALVVGAFAIAGVWARPPRPSLLGFRSTPWLPALGWMVLVYGSFWAFSAAYAQLLRPSAEQQLVQDLRDERSIVVLVGFAVVVSLLAPIAEELFFRGLLFGTLRDRMAPWAAMLVGGTVFGLVHVAGTPVKTLGILVALGVGLCFLYWKTRSVVPGMLIHSINNSIAFGVTTQLRWWWFATLILGSVLLVLIVARVVMAWERRMV